MYIFFFFSGVQETVRGSVLNEITAFENSKDATLVSPAHGRTVLTERVVSTCLVMPLAIMAGLFDSGTFHNFDVKCSKCRFPAPKRSIRSSIVPLDFDSRRNVVYGNFVPWKGWAWYFVMRVEASVITFDRADRTKIGVYYTQVRFIKHSFFFESRTK